MSDLFVSIMKINSNQKHFDIRLILLPQSDDTSELFEISGICQDLYSKGLEIRQFAVHEGASRVLAAQYILKQINNKFASNMDIDEKGAGIREWISRVDSGDQRLFIKSLYDIAVSKKWYG